MAYSDYGGYAYRNGERVRERSDYTITPDGGDGYRENTGTIAISKFPLACWPNTSEDDWCGEWRS